MVRKTTPRPLLTMQVELEKKRAASLRKRALPTELTFCSFASYFIFAIPRFAVAVLINVRDRTTYTAAKGRIRTSIAKTNEITLPAAPEPIQ